MKITGVILFALYLIEVALGTLVHLRRPKDGERAHPPRNVVHVALGLVIFGLSIYEVRHLHLTLLPVRCVVRDASAAADATSAKQTINGADRDPGVSGASEKAVVAICISWAVVSVRLRSCLPTSLR